MAAMLEETNNKRYLHKNNWWGNLAFSRALRIFSFRNGEMIFWERIRYYRDYESRLSFNIFLGPSTDIHSTPTVQNP